MTADHVVADANSITVVFGDGRRLAAAIERRSGLNDLALLRVRSRTEAFLPIAPPASTPAGHRVFVVGFPLTDVLGGGELKFTEGSVTALSRHRGDASQIQFSAPIQPGNSGSPLVNEQGQVVGVVTSAPGAEGGERPELVSWATKSEVASSLVGPQTGGWAASSREQALERARVATVQVLVE